VKPGWRLLERRNAFDTRDRLQTENRIVMDALKVAFVGVFVDAPIGDARQAEGVRV
jgi:hypothetical protein